MAESTATGLVQRFMRLSTAVKMLLILGLALSPLGLVAVMASIDAARDSRTEREVLASTTAEQSASALDAIIARDLLFLRLANPGGARLGAPADRCAGLRASASLPPGVSLSRVDLLDASRRDLCWVRAGLNPATPAAPRAGEQIALEGPGGGLRLSVAAPSVVAVGIIDPALIRSVAGPRPARPDLVLWLEQGQARLRITSAGERGSSRRIVRRAPLAGSDLFVMASLGAAPVTSTEILTILLPLTSWLAAALLGWFIVDRLLLRPIVSMQRAVLAYQPGGAGIEIPRTVTPATELRELGDAFTRVTGTIATHELELEAAMARQVRLVREVHHRVKNNLQVVASLLNLHARSAKSTDAANAYATIQRRVDALAVVHRNHFAELEDDRGVSLRSLLSELTGNLRATAPDMASGMAITLDLDGAHVNQDVAVSVAFFVTEIIEHAMMCTPDQPVGVAVRQSASPTVARLMLSSASLRGDTECPQVDARQFERITTGLARQLRAALERDTEAGVFSIDIAVLGNTSGG